MQVDGEEFRVEDIDEAVDGGVETLGIEFLRQIADDGAFAIVRDAHAIAEHGEKRLLAGHQVGLQQVLADGVAGVQFERFVDPNNRIVSTSANLVNVTGYSINTDYRINDKVLVRIETKQLQATKAIFFNNGNTTFSKSSLLVMGSIAWKLKK